MPRTFDGVDDLVAAVGEDLGRSGPHLVGQREIEAFADATGDRQWIHVDPARAETGPFGRTVAHGYYLVSILPAMFAEIFQIDGVGAMINTGVDEFRFLRPVPSGSTINVGVRLVSVRVRRRGVADLSLGVRFYLDTRPEPVCTGLVHCMLRPLPVH